MTRLKSLLDVPAAQRAPMTREGVEDFVRLSLADQHQDVRAVPIARVLSEMPDDPPDQIRMIVDRIWAYTDVPVRPPVILLAATFCSTPGRCVLWAYTLVVLTQQLGRAITVNDLAMAFPDGFPTDEGHRLIWDAQKDARGNRLDQRECWHPSLGGTP